MSDQPSVQQLIQSLPCRVELPEDATLFFSRRGPLVSQYDEKRQYPRFYCRTEAALVCKQSLPACTRQSRTHRIYVKDISRRSIAFLHFEQLFPCEKVDVILTDGGLRPITVIRCRRIQKDCYEVVGDFSAILA